MKIVVARTAGFCGGVKRAVKIATEGNWDARLVLGSLVHNKRVIEALKNQGISFSDTPIEGYDDYVVSAHGIPFSMYSELPNDKVRDATCPIVEKLFSYCQKAQASVLIVGDANHVEIKNAVSYVKNRVEVLCPRMVDIDKLEKIARNESEQFILVFQTTVSQKIADEYKEVTTRLFGDRVTVHDTLCPSVSKRINEGREIASKVEKMVVIGDRASANCNTLFRECQAVNPDTIFVENADEIYSFEAESVGITAGASVPDEIIREVYEKINLF